MKIKLTLLALVFTSLFANAQEEKCNENLQYFAQYAKNRDYDEAYKYFVPLRKDCPKINKALYVYGESILRNNLEKASNAEEKKVIVNDLISLFDEYDLHFPGLSKGNNLKKAMLLEENNLGSKEEIFKLLDTSFKNENQYFTSAKAMMLYFEIYAKDFEAGNKGIALQQVFDKYDEISEDIEKKEKIASEELDGYLTRIDANEELSDKEKRAKEAAEINIEGYSIVKGSMDAQIILLSTCEKLIPFYEKSYEENKNNELWLKRAAERLEAKECDSDPLFAKITEQLHKLNPTAESAYLLGVSAQKAGNRAKALEYFNQAAELFTDNIKKAKVYYKIATMYGNSNKSQARVYARKALAAKPSFGQSYMLMAQLYASSVNECGNTPFEKRAIYWLCAQYANKAAAVDPALKGTANRQAASYNASAPTKQEIFKEGKAGQRISFSCWVGESVTVPSIK